MKPFDNVAISSTEPKNNADVWIKHGNNVEDDILVNKGGMYTSILNKKEDYSPVFDTTYIKTGTGIVKFCSVINKVAYISLELTLKAVSLGNQQVKLATGLPKTVANFICVIYLYRNNALYKTLRFRISTNGELISWYNETTQLQDNDTFLVNISYPVQ